MKKSITLLAVLATATFASPATAQEQQLEEAVQAAAAKVAGETSVPPGGKTATVAKQRKHKRYKMPVRFAFDLTYDTALYAYLYDINAHSYGAYDCERWNPYKVTCVGWIGGMAPDSSQEYSCDWLQDVWINKKNELHTWVSHVNCYE